MKTRIQVIAVKQLSGKSKTTGNNYDMTICQCVIQGENPQIGELVLPKDHPKIMPGLFDAEFGVAVDMQTKRISGQLVQLTPVSAAARPAAAA